MEKETQKVKERKYLKVYEFGVGIVSVQSGRMTFFDKNTLEEKHKFPFIDLSILKDKKNIGQNLDLDPESKDYVKLIFANIESLEVLERALTFCRKELELKSETKP
jgi:hypothetical protein